MPPFGAEATALLDSLARDFSLEDAMAVKKVCLRNQSIYPYTLYPTLDLRSRHDTLVLDLLL